MYVRRTISAIKNTKGGKPFAKHPVLDAAMLPVCGGLVRRVGAKVPAQWRKATVASPFHSHLQGHPMDTSELEYAGFWIRFWASVIDTILVAIIIYPILTAIYGFAYWESESMIQGPLDFLLSWVAPAVVVVLFWISRQATPGKMAVGAHIVDAKTGGKPTTGQLLGRYAGYYVAAIPLLLGFIWVAFDPRKQGWHDKLAGTVVVRKKAGTTKAVQFNGG